MGNQDHAGQRNSDKQRRIDGALSLRDARRPRQAYDAATKTWRKLSA